MFGQILIGESRWEFLVKESNVGNPLVEVRLSDVIGDIYRDGLQKIEDQTCFIGLGKDLESNVK